MISQQTHDSTDQSAAELSSDPARSKQPTKLQQHQPTATKARILVIEQEKATANLLRQLLSNCGDVKVVSSNKQIAEISAQFEPTIILLCLDLRDKHGLTLCQELKQRDSDGNPFFKGDIVLMTSRKTDANLLRSCRRLADGQIVKPLEAQTVLSLMRHLNEAAREKQQSHNATVQNLTPSPRKELSLKTNLAKSSAAATRSNIPMREPQPEVNEQLQKRSSAVENAATNSAAFAQRHSQFAGPTEIVAKTFGSDTEIFQSLKLILQCRGISDKAGISVASFARRIAVELQKGSKYADCILPSFLEHLHLAAQLYELGCPPIDRNSIEINRMPRAVELALVKKHADIGAAIFNEYIARNSNSVFLKVVRDVALAHRERWDGRGYPDGLCETDIPLAARIVAVAACFHALTAERRFGNTYSPEVARNIISGEAGDQFDPLVIRAFEDAFADVALQCSGLRNEQPPKCDLQLSRELEFGGNRHGTAPRVSEAAARLKKGLQPSLLSRSTQQRSPASFKTRLRQGLLSGDTRSLGNVADDVVQFAIATANDELQTAAQNLLIMIRSDCSIETIAMAFDCLMEAVE